MRKFNPPSKQELAKRARNSRIDLLEASLTIARHGFQGITLSHRELELIEVEKKAREYVDWAEEDSPKGETIPGVSFRFAA